MLHFTEIIFGLKCEQGSNAVHEFLQICLISSIPFIKVFKFQFAFLEGRTFENKTYFIELSFTFWKFA